MITPRPRRRIGRPRPTLPGPRYSKSHIPPADPHPWAE